VAAEPATIDCGCGESANEKSFSGSPLPVRLIECGLPSASLLMTRFAVLVPAAAGEKVTVNEQVAPAGNGPE
jgi:hypothetical protein